jgi:hypothetical protein
MGARMFWTMILAVRAAVSHDFRPRSMAPYLPALIRLRAFRIIWGCSGMRKTFNRQTGRVERKPMTIAQDSFARTLAPASAVYFSHQRCHRAPAVHQL